MLETMLLLEDCQGRGGKLRLTGEEGWKPVRRWRRKGKKTKGTKAKKGKCEDGRKPRKSIPDDDGEEEGTEKKPPPKFTKQTSKKSGKTLENEQVDGLNRN